MHSLGKIVHNGEYSVFTFRWGLSSHKLQSYVRPWPTGHWEQMKVPSWSTMSGLAPCADGTGSHIFTGVSCDGWPPEMALKQDQGAGDSRMTGET